MMRVGNQSYSSSPPLLLLHCSALSPDSFLFFPLPKSHFSSPDTKKDDSYDCQCGAAINLHLSFINISDLCDKNPQRKETVPIRVLLHSQSDAAAVNLTFHPRHSREASVSTCRVMHTHTHTSGVGFSSDCYFCKLILTWTTRWYLFHCPRLTLTPLFSD